jgi:hypothetical protein
MLRERGEEGGPCWPAHKVQLKHGWRWRAQKGGGCTIMSGVGSTKGGKPVPKKVTRVLKRTRVQIMYPPEGPKTSPFKPFFFILQCRYPSGGLKSATQKRTRGSLIWGGVSTLGVIAEHPFPKLPLPQKNWYCSAWDRH